MIGYDIIQYNTIQYNTIQYNTIQYNTIMQYNSEQTPPQLQCNTIQYNTIAIRFCDASCSFLFCEWVDNVFD